MKESLLKKLTHQEQVTYFSLEYANYLTCVYTPELKCFEKIREYQVQILEKKILDLHSKVGVANIFTIQLDINQVKNNLDKQFKKLNNLTPAEKQKLIIKASEKVK